MRDRERFSPAQCRAGRGLLGWDVDKLASAARLDPEAVELFEAGDGDQAEDELSRLGQAFSRAEVIALGSHLAGEGVRFSRPRPRYAGLDPFDGPSVFDMARACAAVAGALGAALSIPPNLRRLHVR